MYLVSKYIFYIVYAVITVIESCFINKCKKECNIMIIKIYLRENLNIKNFWNMFKL